MLRDFKYNFETLGELQRETQILGKKLFGPTSQPSLILLRGDLGAGKTEFTRQTLLPFGFGSITSPTYTLHHVYESPNVDYLVHHFDFYRLKEERELEDFDFFRLLGERASHVFVEWPKWNLTSPSFLEKLDRDVIQVGLTRKSLSTR